MPDRRFHTKECPNSLHITLTFQHPICDNLKKQSKQPAAPWLSIWKEWRLFYPFHPFIHASLILLYNPPFNLSIATEFSACTTNSCWRNRRRIKQKLRTLTITPRRREPIACYTDRVAGTIWGRVCADDWFFTLRSTYVIRIRINLMSQHSAP